MRTPARFHSCLGPDIEQFLAHKRSLGTALRQPRRSSCWMPTCWKEMPAVSGGDVRLGGRVPAFTPVRAREATTTCAVPSDGCSLIWWIACRLAETPLRSPPRRARYERTPFIFDTTSAKRLLAKAKALPSKGGTLNRGDTYVLFAVLYGLGLRVGEACRLRIQDVDLGRRLLVIRETKFYKSHLVPFGPKIEALLTEHIHQRWATLPGAARDEARCFACVEDGASTPAPSSDLSCPRSTTGTRDRAGRLLSAPARPAPCLRRRHAHSMVPARLGSANQALALSLHGARRHQLHRGVPDDDAGSARTGQSPFRELRYHHAQGGSSVMTTPLGPLVRSFFIDHLPMQRACGKLDPKLPRHDPSVPVLRVGTTWQSDHDLGCRRPVLRAGSGFPEVSGTAARQLRANPQPAPGRAEHLLYPFGFAHAGDAGGLPANRRDPGQANNAADTHYLEREEVTALFRSCQGRVASRFVIARSCCFSTTPAHGYRKPPICALSISTLTHRPRCICTARETSGVCPLWEETSGHLRQLAAERRKSPIDPVFVAGRNRPARFGIYKIVRRHAAPWDTGGLNHGKSPAPVSPYRRGPSAGVRVEVNVIRSGLTCQSRYHQPLCRIDVACQGEALRTCELPSELRRCPALVQSGRMTKPYWNG